MNRIAQEVNEFLVSMGIAPSDQHPDYRLEIAYRIGYEDAIRNYATCKDGDKFVGALSRPIKDVLSKFRNTEVPERY